MKKRILVYINDKQVEKIFFDQIKDTLPIFDVRNINNLGELSALTNPTHSPAAIIIYLGKPDEAISGQLADILNTIPSDTSSILIYENGIKLAPLQKLNVDVLLCNDPNTSVLSNSKNTNEVLKETERRVTTMIDNLPGIAYQCKNDANWTMIFVSKNASELTGYSSDDFLGNKTIAYNDIIFPEDRELVNSSVQRALLNNQPFQIEYRIVTRDNKIKWVWEQGREVQVHGSSEKLLEGLIIDISERKLSQIRLDIMQNISGALNRTKDLAELIALIERELSKAINTRNFLIALYDEKTDSFSFPYMKDERDHFTEIPAKKTISRLVIKRNKSMLLKDNDIDRLEQAGEIERVGSPAKCWLGVPLHVEDKVIGIIVLQDYEDRNAVGNNDWDLLEFVSTQVASAILKKLAREKAEETDRLKTTFLANMSHEIRTPMNAIIGFTEMLHQGKFQLEEQQKLTKLIIDNGRKLLGIIDDITDIAKIEAGQLSINPGRCSANKILFDHYYSFKELRLKMGKEHIDIVARQYKPDQNFIFSSDAKRINQVITNLMSNAMKYTLEGSIELGYDIQSGRKGNFIDFYVKDTGIGIRADNLEKIFDRFRQLDDIRVDEIGGNGLGLAISINIAHLLGGKIEVTSKVGKGSTFHLIIPFTEIVEDYFEPDTPEDPNKKQDWPNKKILIAEDEDSNFHLLEILLRKTRVKIIRAYNGKEALDFIRGGKEVDLILMDMRMPLMDGYEATALIKKIKPEIPIVAQTAYALTGDREISLDAGCDNYISKPIKKEELFNVIGKYFDK